jgi:hypothetical protein
MLPHKHARVKNLECEIWCFYSTLAEETSLAVCDAVSLGQWFPTFREIAVASRQRHAAKESNEWNLRKTGSVSSHYPCYMTTTPIPTFSILSHNSQSTRSNVTTSLQTEWAGTAPCRVSGLKHLVSRKAVAKVTRSQITELSSQIEPISVN